MSVARAMQRGRSTGLVRVSFVVKCLVDGPWSCGAAGRRSSKPSWRSWRRSSSSRKKTWWRRRSPQRVVLGAGGAGGGGEGGEGAAGETLCLETKPQPEPTATGRRHPYSRASSVCARKPTRSRLLVSGIPTAGFHAAVPFLLTLFHSWTSHVSPDVDSTSVGHTCLQECLHRHACPCDSPRDCPEQCARGRRSACPTRAPSEACACPGGCSGDQPLGPRAGCGGAFLVGEHRAVAGGRAQGGQQKGEAMKRGRRRGLTRVAGRWRWESWSEDTGH